MPPETAPNEKNVRANISLVILDAMKLRGYNIEKLSLLSGIAEHILQMLIEEKFHKLPAAPYLRGYMIKLGEVLHVDGKELWEIYIQSNPELRRPGTRDVLPKKHFSLMHMSKRQLLFIGLILVFIGIFLWRVFIYFSPGELTISNIPDEYVITSQEFTIQGTVDPSSQLAVNGEIVYSDKEGNFEKTVALHPGFNTITFTVKRILGRESVYTKQIFYQKEDRKEGTKEQQTQPQESSQTVEFE